MAGLIPELLTAQLVRLFPTPCWVVDQVQIELRVTDDRDTFDSLDPVEDAFVVRREEVDAAPGLNRTEIERFREALDPRSDG